MNRWRVGLCAAAAGTVTLALSVVMVTQAQAHGSMQNPVSRVYECYLEGPEHPQTNACKDAVAIGGTQPLYDWNEIHILDAAGRSKQIIPDGKLCSAGTDKYKAFDQARADWPATTLPTSGPYTFQYKATAPHRGSFEFYVTRTGYDPTKPLKWSDLEATPFFRVTDPPLANGVYTMTAQLPTGRTGRHLIYTIWQRSDSPEAFYTCSDVLFGNASPTRSPSPTKSASPSPTKSTSPTPTKSGTCSALPWVATTQYPGGSVVSYAGHAWKAQWWTQGETPGTAAVWVDQGTCTPASRTPGSCTAPVWDATSIYTGGALVAYQAHTWKAQWWTQGETPGTAAVWVDQGLC
jgi:chitin-binding protein